MIRLLSQIDFSRNEIQTAAQKQTEFIIVIMTV